MIGSDILSESNKLCKHSDLHGTRRLEELQSEFAEAPPIFISTSYDYQPIAGPRRGGVRGGQKPGAHSHKGPINSN